MVAWVWCDLGGDSEGGEKEAPEVRVVFGDSDCPPTRTSEVQDWKRTRGVHEKRGTQFAVKRRTARRIYCYIHVLKQDITETKLTTERCTEAGVVSGRDDGNSTNEP
jgi:hypothetical protein